MTAVGILAADAQRCATRSHLGLLSTIRTGAPCESSYEPWRRAASDSDGDDEENLLFEVAPIAVMRHSFAPGRDATARAGGAALRRTETLVNSACGELFGMHAEELLARVMTMTIWRIR